MQAAAIRQEAAQAAAAADHDRLIVLAKQYTSYLSPMFHLIPWDDKKIIEEKRFVQAYTRAAEATNYFTNVTPDKLTEVILGHPSTLTIFRIIAGYRVQELAYVLELKFGIKAGESTIRLLESSDEPVKQKPRQQVEAIGKALFAAVQGTLLPRPPHARGFIDRHDKFDTVQGWKDVAKFARS